MTTLIREMKLTRIQIEIRLHYPGFAVLAGITDWSEDETIPTACTNGTWVKFNPAFVGQFVFKQQVFIALHELLHICRKHMLTRGSRDPELFNIACDHYINLLLMRTCGTRAQMPQLEGSPIGYADSRFTDMTEYEIYNILKKEQDSGQDVFSQGTRLGEVSDLLGSDEEGANEAEVEAVVHKINTAIQTAEAVGKMSGKGASLWEQLAGDLRAPQIPWQSVLRRFMTKVFPSFRAWSNLDRRMLASGIAYPAVVKTGTQELVFGTDCSGSMPRTVVVRALDETVSATEQCHIQKTHVVYFTSNIDGHDTFGTNEKARLRDQLPIGGTCLQTFMDHVKEKCPNAKGIICMTDGDFGNWPSDPGVPVIWGMTPQRAKQYPPPFGATFLISEDE